MEDENVCLVVTLWTGPACPICGHKRWINISGYGYGKQSMICDTCRYECGPQVKHLHKHYTADELADELVKL